MIRKIEKFGVSLVKKGGRLAKPNRGEKEGMIKKIAKWETNNPKKVVIIAILLLIPAFIGFLCTGVNYDILTYLPENLESMQGNQILDETFNSAGMAIVVVDNMPQRYTAALKEEMTKIDGVKNVMWSDMLMGPEVPVEVIPDMLKDIFYSKDEKKTMLLVQFEDSGSADSTMAAIKNIKKLLNERCFISGVSAITEDMKELVEGEAILYIIIAVSLVIIAMLLMTESWCLPFVVMSVLGAAILYNMGTNIFLGEISFITETIAAVLQIGVTMDYSIFLIDRYGEEKLKFDDRRDAMASAVVKAFTALMGSSLTTIFGFAALMFMQLRLGFDIGLVMAKGVILGIASVVLILPAVILVTEKYIDKYKHKSFMPEFSGLNDFVYKHKKALVIIFAVLLIPSYFLQSKPDMYYNMDKALPQDLISVKGLNKLKEDFDMASTQFVIVDDTIPGGTLMRMEDEIGKLDGIASVIAYNTLVGPAIPDNIIPDELLAICKKDGKQMMMVNSKYSTASDELNAQIDTMTQIVKRYDPSALITGEGAMTRDLKITTDRDFMVTNILSIAAILIVIGICLKSFSLPLLLVLSIEFAIWINIALSVIMGDEMAFVTPTIVSCVQLGATVDYAILLTTRFREELQGGKNKKEAIMSATLSTEKSVLQSASVLFLSNFGVYLICDINLVKGVCSLLARGSLISALVIAFFLSPLLYTFEGAINKTTIGWRADSPVKLFGKKRKEEKVNAE